MEVTDKTLVSRHNIRFSTDGDPLIMGLAYQNVISVAENQVPTFPVLICIPVLTSPLLSCVFVLLICRTGLDL